MTIPPTVSGSIPDPYGDLPSDLVALLRDPRIEVPGHAAALEKVHEWVQKQPVNSADNAVYVTGTERTRTRRITGDTP
jgi:hypothetical protein